ncbi:hypothetical protein [Haloferax sulfurifontis]|uniref:Uncharacterized protein n=2 Tax=Haloferax sulfurifontis TaxID=255616 RepID=M0I8I4_9EURY|nr:hypothetical protein [Haloferax sulfurifontis]ELZ93081.1 hypothetical protein C441_09346 [Haloferax sulfurifontis ATCC BAA-897]GGC54438.1 hypothetical protein GCM10007209_15240 [Haloferax sulfurifontis]
MVSIELSGPILVAAAVLGAAWLYRDAKRRAMDTADMWAVGFFVAFVLLPVLGGLAVLAFYLQNRNRRRGSPVAVPGK